MVSVRRFIDKQRIISKQSKPVKPTTYLQCKIEFQAKRTNTENPFPEFVNKGTVSCG